MLGIEHLLAERELDDYYSLAFCIAFAPMYLMMLVAVVGAGKMFCESLLHLLLWKFPVFRSLDKEFCVRKKLNVVQDPHEPIEPERKHEWFKAYIAGSVFVFITWWIITGVGWPD